MRKTLSNYGIKDYVKLNKNINPSLITLTHFFRFYLQKTLKKGPRLHAKIRLNCVMFGLPRFFNLLHANKRQKSCDIKIILLFN